MAQLVISAAGAGVGFLLGGPTGAQIGWVAGSAIGGALFPTKGPSGPRLSDLKVSGSAYGSPIPYVEGHPRVAGQVIWASDKYAVTTESGGKGGPNVETTSTIYKVDLLILLSSNEIAGVRRVWSNGALVWTAADDATGDSLAASSATEHWDAIAYYGGDAAQLPDPTYEAAVGIGNAPAYRGRGTVMIEGLNLGSSGVLPNLTFELAPLGTSVTGGFTEDFEAAGFNYYGWPGVDNGFEEQIGPWGTMLHAKGGAENNIGDLIERVIDPVEASRIRFRFKVATNAYPGNPDDACFFYARNGTTLVFAFWPRRELVYDSLERAYATVSGMVPVSPAKLTDDVWYTGDYEVTGPSTATFTIRYYDTDAVVATTALGVASTSIVDRLQFEQTWAPGSGNLPDTWYDQIRLGAGSETFGLTDAPLDDVVERLCVRAGLTTGQVDVTALAGQSVRSLAVAQVTPTRSVIEVLAGAYRFEGVESLGKLKFVLRGGASAATIAYASMGAGREGATAEPLPLTMLNDVETPAQVTVRYVNASNDYQDGAESSDRLLGPGIGVQVLEVPLGLTPAEARELADIQIMDVAASQRKFGPVSLSNDYAHLEPTDIVTLTDTDASTYRGRILTMRSGGGVHTIEGVIEDASILTSTIATDTDYDESADVAGAVETVLELLDIPLLRDDDDGPGFYAAFKGADTPWPGCVLFGSADGVTYTQIGSAIAEATQIGECTTTLGDWTGGTVFDEKNSVTVDVGAQTLASWSRDEILAGTATGYVVGDELLYARTATLVSPGVYTLTGLLRGRRGTEWAIAGHGSGERFVALPASGRGLRRVALSATEIGVTRYYKAVTAGRALSTATAQTLACAGVSQIPFSPVDLRASVSDSAVEVTWKRRTRYATRFTGSGGISVPLGEDTEAYTAELRDGGSVLVSTETVTDPAWSNGSAAVVLTLAAPTRNIASIGGELVGIFDDEQYNSANPPSFERLTADTGAQIERSPTIGSQVYQWAADGDDLYAACADISYVSTPTYYTAGRVVRYDRADLSAPAATYTAATAGDPAGVAHDGTDVWMTERYGDNLRKLNASTLASAATYPLGDELGALVHDSGTLWICSPNTDEVIEWDIGTTAELSRVSVAYRPTDVLVSGSYLWVLSAAELAVYNKGTGALIATAAVTPLVTFAGKTLCEFDGDIACIDVRASGQVVTLLDVATGAVLRAIDPADPYLHAISAIGTTLYITTSAPTHAGTAAAYELATPGLSGYSLTVAQQGTIGDGYSTEITL